MIMQKSRWPLVALLTLGVGALLYAGMELRGAPDKSATPAAQDAGPTAQVQTVVLGMGCFWGAEKRIGALPGVVDVESGYANGEVAGTYEAVLSHERVLQRGSSNKRNHTEVVKVSFDPAQTTLERVLAAFWESHDPTQGDRQGNDIGSNYRSAIYTEGPGQAEVASRTHTAYQKALTQAGRGTITTEIAPLTVYYRAEDYHQDYLQKNPLGYCGLGGTGVAYPGTAEVAPAATASGAPLDGAALAQDRQLVVFEAEDCGSCKRLKADILDQWQSPISVARSLNPSAPTGWTLAKSLFATPTLVLFEDGQEVSRYTGYDGDQARFWKWLGHRLLTPEQRRVAFEQGTEGAFTGSHLDESRPGTFVDPITGAALFRSDTKFDSGTGWPSFFKAMSALSVGSP